MVASANSHPSPVPEEKAILFSIRPGVGKTHAIINALAEGGKRCIYAAPTHELCQEIVARCEARGVSTHYWRAGPTEEDACPHMDMVQFYRDNGYIIRHGPCRHCVKQSSCAYRKVFTSKRNLHAQAFVMTTWHLRRQDFWSLNAAENRPLVVLDEDACEALAAPKELKFDALSRFVAALQAVRDLCGNPLSNEGKSDADAWLMRKIHMPSSGGEAELALSDILRRVCLELMGRCVSAGDGCWHEGLVMHETLRPYDHALLQDNDLFEALLASAYSVAMDGVDLPNLFQPLRALASTPTPMHASKRGVQWPDVASIPSDRRIIMLDATAEPSVVEGVIGRPVEVFETEQIEQQATIYQVMDQLLTRNGTKRITASGNNFIETFLQNACRKHIDGSILVVTFMDQEKHLQECADAVHPNVTVRHYGALRGLDSFGSHDVGIIVGRPMPNEARLALLAVSAFGMDALIDRSHAPSLDWKILDKPVGRDLWRCRLQEYDDPRWQAVWHHVVSGELLQAVGRLRPLTNPATIYVLTCEPLPDAFEVEGVFASELFPEMCLFGRRKDFVEGVKRYAEALGALRGSGEPTSNANVCRHLGINEDKGLKYRELAEIAYAAKSAETPPFSASAN